MANTTNLVASSLTTDFNVTPYYDDYDIDKQFYRILFKPGYAVQARELTQMQTALQEQISRFGKNIFKDGTIVLPGATTLETNNGLPAGRGTPYVKIKDFSSSNNTVDIAVWENLIEMGKESGNTRLEITGLTSNIKAKVLQIIDGNQNSQNTKTIYVSYISGSNTGNYQVKTFLPGETLLATVANNTYNLVVHDTDPAPIGVGSRFGIEKGVVFAKNHFIAFQDQTVIIDRYEANPTARIGFYIEESIIDYTSDSSLLDPALEASNYTAPGADRLYLNPVLTSVSIDATLDGQNFVTLLTVSGGILTSVKTDTAYNIVNDAMAKRTYDNSGDYVVEGLNIQLKEHDNNGTNFGRFDSGNNELLFVGVAAGLGYVQGYKVDSLVTVDMETEKGIKVANVRSQISTTNMGQYVTVNEFVGGWELNKGNSIDLYNTAMDRISTKDWSITTQAGSKIGSATLLSYNYVTGIEGYDAKYDVYLSDIKMLGSNNFSSVRSLYAASGGYNAAPGADIVLDLANNAILQHVPESTLLYYIGSNHSKTIRDASDPLLTRTSYQYYKTDGVASTVQVSSNGLFTIAITSGNEILPYGTTTLSTSDKKEIRATFNQTSGASDTMSVTLTGTSTGGAATTTLLGTGTYFTRLNVGDKIQLSSNNTVYYITNIISDTTMTVDTTLPSNVTGNTVYKVYKSGDMLDLSKIGADAGEEISISTTPSSLTFDLQETFPTTFYVTLTYPIEKTSALEIKKTLKTSRYVVINCATAGMTGPYDLGFSDVYKIRSIRLKEGSTPVNNTDGTNGLSSFIFKNGQKDTYYDHATLKPRATLTSNTRILVELDYFLPDYTLGSGYFSIDSYPIEDDDNIFNPSKNIRTENIPVFKSTNTGQNYDLRNYLDFRPIKINTASDAVVPASATTNPTSTTSYYYSATGIKFPVPSTSVEYDYYYYLGRTDIVAVDRDNRFQILKGIPSGNPQTPVIPPGLMALASLTIVPYPTLSPAYAISIGRPELAAVSKSLSNLRYTMRDIGQLKQRIVNLEYYTSLNVLQRAAADMRITSTVTGLDRFKNGIFTDNFVDNSLGATYDSEFRIVYDNKEKTIRPVYKMESIAYDYLSGTNVKFNNPIITVDYNEIIHYQQQYATTDINVERQSWLFLGTLNLFPAQDIWIDTKIMPDEQLSNKATYVVVYGTQGTANQAITAYGTTAQIVPGGAYGVTTNYGKFLSNTTPGVLDILNNTTWNAWNTHVVGYKVYTGNVTTDGNPLSVQYTNYDQARSYAQSINGVGGAGVTIETVYNTARTGTQYWEADGTDVVQTGYKLLDVQNYAYIRPQTITVNATGLKPYTQIWPYFDNAAMANSARPLTANQFSWIISHGQYGLAANTLIDLQANTSSNASAGLIAPPGTLGTWSPYGTQLVTDAEGRCDFQMKIEAGQFRVGQRSMLVIDSRLFVDVSSFSDASSVPPDVSTGAQANFMASGQSITKQRSILSTKTVSYHTEAVAQDYNSAAYDYIAPPPPPVRVSGSCSAYSFLASATEGEEGIFLTSIDIFVSRIGREGFWVEIREMDSGESITRNTVPYSEVFFNKPSEVPISPNGKDNPCRIKFQAPLFLYHNTQYACVIHPINANPDLYVWISRLGQLDNNGLGKVVDRRGKGTFYQTNNNTNWDIIPEVDLTVKFYRADFMKNVDATAYLGNRPIEKLFVKNDTIDFTGHLGEVFVSGDHLTLSSSNAASLNIGDYAVGTTSSLNTALVNVSSAIATGNIGYYQGEVVKFYDANTGSYKGEAIVSDINNGRGILSYYVNGDTSLVHLSGSGGGFVIGDKIMSGSSIGQFGHLENIFSISNYRYSAYSFEPSFLKFDLTDIKFFMRPVSIDNTIDSYVDLEPSTTQYFNDEKVILSRSNEVGILGAEPSNKIKVTMRTGSNTVSPVLDTASTQTIILDNIINNDITYETTPYHGSLINKYISKTVTLAEGQDAEDNMVILTAYRPPGTDVKVWLRVLHNEDDTPFTERPWIELVRTPETEGLYSAINDRNNFKEYTYLVPEATTDRLIMSSSTVSINIGDTLIGLSSNVKSAVSVVEGDTIYSMNKTGFIKGETANVVNSGGYVVGNTTIGAIGRTVALNTTWNATSNVITYTTDQGVQYSTYKYFAIKVGLLNDGENSAVVPRVGDLRSIAIQK